MANYKNKKCPICGGVFVDADDIVVCPECGAPYHRNCYQSLGYCAYKNVHGTDEIANLPHNCSGTEDGKNEISKKKQCPRCFSDNDENVAFCNSCGFVFLSDQDKKQSNNPFKNEFSMIFDPMGGVDPSELMDDVPAGEIAKFVKNNTLYYLPVFKKLERKGKSKFNFSAFLFSGAWLLYRKQYKLGAILTALNFGMMILASAINFKIFELSQDSVLVLAFLFNLINMLVMIFSGIFANKIYFKHCIKNIKLIKSENKLGSKYTEEILSKGGVNIRIIPVLIVCYIIIECLPKLIS